MDIKPPHDRSNVVPQCRAPPIVIRHPHYPTHENTLFRLPRLDVIEKGGLADSDLRYGINHHTTVMACQIITGNAQGIVLSYDRFGRQTVTMGYEGVLTHSEYYLQVPLGPGVVGPYPVICDFEDWLFPDCLPEPWLLVRDELMGQYPWLHRNRMQDYLAIGQEKDGYEGRANVIHIRADILQDFDRRAFALVPKMTSNGYRLVLNYFSTADDLTIPANVYHNRMTHPLGGVSVEFLYTRFAYAVFALVEGFATTGLRRRLGIVDAGSDELGLPTWVCNRHWMTSEEVAARRAARVNPASKKRSADEAALDHAGHVATNRPQQTPEAEWIMPPDDRPPGPLTLASFSTLPQNVRLRIWEATWPDPRVIEILSLPQIESAKIYDLSRLQLYGTISNLLDGDDNGENDDDGESVVGEGDDAINQGQDRGGSLDYDANDDYSPPSCFDSDDFDMEDARREARNPRRLFWQMARENQHPVALSVCRESRLHTRTNLYLLKHQERSHWSFYLNPTQDIVWISDSLWDWGSDDGDAARLAHSYGSRLSHIEHAIVSADKWEDLEELDILWYFGSLKTIKFLLDHQVTDQEISTLLNRIRMRYGNDDRFCSRFELVDRCYRVRGYYWCVV